MRTRITLPFGPAHRKLSPLSPGSGRTIAAATALAVVGSTAEAVALVLVARAALAVTASEVHLDVGLDVRLGVTTALVCALAALLLKLGTSVISARLTSDLSARTVRHGRHLLLTAYFGSTWAAQSTERLGELQDYLTTTVTRLNGVNQAFISGLNALVSFSVILVSAVFVNPVAAIGCGIAAMLLLFILRPLSRLTRRFTALQSDATRALAGEITEAVRLSQEIKTSGVRERVLDRLNTSERAASEPLRKANFTSTVAPAIYQTLALLLLVLAVLAVSLAAAGQVASLSAAVLLLLRGLGYGQQLQSAMQNLANTLPFLDALHARLKSYEAAAEQAGGVRLTGPLVSLRLDHVTYTYGGGGGERKSALRDVDLELVRNESLGIVGPSGSGKSTLLQLLLRLRRPTDGRVLVNGNDLWELREQDWTSRVAFVHQEARLLSGSVADNIAFYRNADHAAIVAAAKLAHIHDDIEALGEGYDSLVGPAGSQLSGGQKQRIAIARALIGNPELIILDEPTSALDLPSEARFQETLRDLKGRVTIIVVAHRLTTVRDCDKILVLRGGEQEGYGPHAELLGGSAFYRHAMSLSQLPFAEEGP